MVDISKFGLLPDTSDNTLVIDVTDTESFLVRKDADGGDILLVDTTNGVVAIGGVTPVTGCRLVLPQENDAATPTLAFGVGKSGFYESSPNTLCISINSASKWEMSSNQFVGVNATGPRLANESCTGTNPTLIPHKNDPDTGVGRDAANILALITGGVGSYYQNAAGTTQRWCTQESVADSGKVVTMPATSNGGFGFAQLGDGEEYALFSFTSAGVITLISNSANVSTTVDNDTTFNIYDNGTRVAFNNELGATKNLFVMAWIN